MPRKIEISHRTIVFFVIFLLSLWVLYYIRDIILQLFVALLLMSILDPWVSLLSRYKIPRSLSIFITYLIVVGVLGTAIAGILPPLIEQTSNLAVSLPAYISKLGLGSFLTDQLTNQVFSYVARVPGEAVKLSFSIVSDLLSLLFILIFTFYLLLSRDKMDGTLSNFFGDEKKDEIRKVIDVLEARLGGWARGELALMALVGVANFIGLTILGIPFAISLAIIAGILEVVPYVGPIVAGALATIIGLSISPVTGLGVVAMAFLVQQVENYFFVPKVMEKSVGVNPLIIILALTIGFRLFGFIGVFLSVPFVITLQVLSKEYILRAEK